MKAEIEFIKENQIHVRLDNYEELIGYLRNQNPISDKKKKEVIESLTHIFEKAPTSYEATRFVGILAEPLLMGMTFQTIVGQAEANRKRIGARIKELREARGYTARDLAFMTRIDPANLSRIEQGKYSVTIDTLDKIAYFLDCRIQLVEYKEPQALAHKEFKYE